MHFSAAAGSTAQDSHSLCGLFVHCHVPDHLLNWAWNSDAANETTIWLSETAFGPLGMETTGAASATAKRYTMQEILALVAEGKTPEDVRQIDDR